MRDIVDPIPCPEAFSVPDSEDAYVSQATLLLALGSLLRPEWSSLATDWSPNSEDEATREAARQFPLPVVMPLEMDMRLDSSNVADYLEELFASSIEDESRRAEMARQLFNMGNDNPSEETQVIAGALMAVSLSHSSEMVRVGAAASIVDVFDPSAEFGMLESLSFDPFPPFPIWRMPQSFERPPNIFGSALAQLVLAAGISTDSAVSEVACTVLGRLSRSEQEQQEQQEQQTIAQSTVDTERKVRSLLVHGTIGPKFFHNAKLDDWWSPIKPGDLFDYIKRSVSRPDLYDHSDTFDWEGNYNAATRNIAAHRLCNWLNDRSEYIFDVAAHSHGNNLIFQALNMGMKVRNILALSCPVHAAWLPGHSSYDELNSVRVHLDGAIIGDRARQKFPSEMGVDETYVGWFLHSRSRRPDIWKNYRIDKLFQR